MWIKNVQHSLNIGVCTSFHPSVSSPFHPSSSVIYSMLNQCKKSCFIDHPSCIYRRASIESLTDLCVSHAHCVMSFYSSSSRWEWRSVLCYLFCACLIRVSCIILAFILSPATCVNLIWLCTVWIIGYLLRPFIFVLLRYYLMCVKLQFRNIYKSKATEKVSGLPHMVCLSFIEKRERNLMLEIDAVSVYK